MDRYNRISTTDTRLIRRIVRDYQFRSYSAIHTLNTWHQVTDGEEKNIFPFQEDADRIFNTSLIYELGALKPIAMPLLQEITPEYKEYAEAQRLINILKYFLIFLYQNMQMIRLKILAFFLLIIHQSLKVLMINIIDLLYLYLI